MHTPADEPQLDGDAAPFAPSAAPAPPPVEVITDFEDAETGEAEDLPLLAADYPAPLTINTGALSDDGFAPPTRTRPPSHVAKPQAPRPANPADAFAAAGVGPRQPAPADDFEALLADIEASEEPGQAPAPQPAPKPQAAAPAPAPASAPPAQGPTSAHPTSKAKPAPPQTRATPVDQPPVKAVPHVPAPVNVPVTDEEPLIFGDEVDEDELLFGDDYQPPAPEAPAAIDEDPFGAAMMPLADDTDFWATLEARPDEDENDVPSLDADQPAATRRRVSQSLFGQRPEPESIDPSVIERARQDKPSLDPAATSQPTPATEAPLATDEAAESVEEWKPTVHVAARQAMFAGPNALSLLSPNLKDDVDELNHALSAFADLEPGQKGFIRLSLRSYPEFKAESKQWLAMRKSGQAPPETKPHKIVWNWLRYGLSLLWFEANKQNPSALGGKVPPLAPGKRGNVKDLTASQAGAEESQAWKDAEKKVLASPHYECDLRVGVVGKTEDAEDVERIAEQVANGFGVYQTTHQELVWAPADPFDTAIGCMGAKRDNVMLALSADEVGELARVPDDLTRPQGVGVKRSNFKQLPLPNPLVIEDPYNPPKGIIPLGIQNPNSEDAIAFGMRVSELDKHMYYVGATGTGKSELMKWLIFGVAKADYPLVVLDPHGALSEDVLNMLVANVPERLNDIVFCDLSDGDYPVALNPLDIHSPDSIEPTVHSIMEMLERQMNLGQSAPRAINLARQALSALCEANLHIKDPDTKCTLLHVVTFFIDVDFRRLVMEFCTNMAVRETFDPETGPYEVLSDKQQTEYAMPIIRAFQPLASSDSFSAVFAAGENRLDFGRLIGDKKIVLVKLARFSHQKALGEFVGALILPWLLSSMDDWGRKRDPETGEYVGRGCRVFVDEAPTLLGEKSSAVQLMAESRKWDLGLITTSQYPSQFPKNLLEALFANTKTKISLALDPSESGALAKSIAGTSGKVTAGDVSDLPNFHYYANILLPTDVGSSPSGPFSAACLPPINCDLTPESKELRELVRQRSRDLICNRKEDIAAKRMNLLDHIKGALGQMLIERADSGEGPLTPGNYDIGPLDDQSTFNGW